MRSGHPLDSEPSPIVNFYSGTSPDSEGRQIEEIWDWDKTRLESVHNYIQWLFPLPTRSQFNWRAPVLSSSDVEAFRESDLLRKRLLKSLEVILRFYGLTLLRASGGDPIVEKSPDFTERAANWLNPGNHNHLRLTRILTSTSVLGLRPEAEALQRCLLDIAHEHPEAVTPDTVRFWETAVSP